MHTFHGKLLPLTCVDDEVVRLAKQTIEHYYRFKHHCRPITAGLYWAGIDKSSLPVQTLTDIQMIGVGVKPALKLIITAGSWLESVVNLHCRFVARIGSDNELHCRFVAGTGSDNKVHCRFLNHQ
jgi:hypothetical protein